MNFNASVPIYLQIAGAIKRMIVSGQWKMGDKIPPVREMALEMGVNPNTMQKAMALLEDEGLLYTERTSGRYVTKEEGIIAKARKEMTGAEMKSFRESMRGMGYEDGETLEIFTRYIREEGA